jgi:hypothetical protein
MNRQIVAKPQSALESNTKLKALTRKWYGWSLLTTSRDFYAARGEAHKNMRGRGLVQTHHATEPNAFGPVVVNH